jgi:hypothetical protein
MGGTSSNISIEDVNQTINDTVNNFCINQASSAGQGVSIGVKQLIKIKNLNIENCDVTLNEANISGNFKFLSEFTPQNVTELTNNLIQNISNSLTRSKRLDTQMGASWGRVDDETVRQSVKNIVENTVKNSVNVSQINSAIQSISTNVDQSTLAEGDVTCKNGKLTTNNAQILLTAQATAIANMISSNITKNSSFTKLVNDLASTSEEKSTGIAGIFSSILSGLLPIVIIFAIVFLVGGKVVGGVTTGILNWKLWLIFGLIVAVFFTLAYFIRFWPFRRHWAPQLDKDGLKTNGCVRDDRNGTFNSIDDCLRAVQDPKSIYYWNKYYTLDDGCKQRTPWSDKSTLTKEECDARKSKYIPQYTYGMSAEELQKYTNIRASCDSNSAYTSCAKASDSVADISGMPSFDSLNDCCDHIGLDVANGQCVPRNPPTIGSQQKPHYVANCAYDSKGNVDPSKSCNRVFTTLDGYPAVSTVASDSEITDYTDYCP